MNTTLTAAECLARVAELRAEDAALKPIFSDHALAVHDYAQWHAAATRSVAILGEINSLLNQAADLVAASEGA